MEAFKAHIKKEYPYINSGDKICAWDIWRATLEWTLKTAEELVEQDAPICMREVIEQELKED